MRPFLILHKKRIILLLILFALVLPVHMTCGHLFYGCATAPDPSGYYYTYYEVEPLGITLFETIIQTNLRIYYWSGRDTHFIGSA